MSISCSFFFSYTDEQKKFLTDNSKFYPQIYKSSSLDEDSFFVDALPLVGDEVCDKIEYAGHFYDIEGIVTRRKMFVGRGDNEDFCDEYDYFFVYVRVTSITCKANEGDLKHCDTVFESTKCALSKSIMEDLRQCGHCPVAIYNVLMSCDIETYADLCQYEISELRKFRGFGPRKIEYIVNLLNKCGLKLGMDVKQYGLRVTRKLV